MSSSRSIDSALSQSAAWPVSYTHLPSGILEDATATHLYITDQTLNQVAWYSVGTNGIPNLLGTVQTDAGPMGMSFDLNGQYLYVTAYSANTLDGFTIGANGQPARSTVAGTAQTGTGPTCVTVSGAPSNANPSHAVYLYTCLLYTSRCV